MELANHSTHTLQTRLASPNDVGAITSLLQQAEFSHFHADWQLPIDWIGQPAFLVAEQQATHKTNPFIGKKNRLEGCLAIVATPPPVAWVRVAGVKELTILKQLLAEITPQLQQAGITTIGWLPSYDWVNIWAPTADFHQLTELETYVKMDIQQVTQPSPIPFDIRPATQKDILELTHLETASFDPLWRYDTQNLQFALNEAYRFEVATIKDDIVGYIVTTDLSHKTVHLARLAITPQYQERGFASALLSHAILQYQQDGIKRISLNTQTNNLASQRLYKRLGFQPTGQRVPVWVKELS